jgi:hypothetical protein
MSLGNDKNIIRKSRGNCRVDSLNPFDWVGGTWFLYSHKLNFISNSTNTKSHEEIIPLESIASIEIKYNDFLSSKLSILLKNDSLVELHVRNRRNWLNDIGNALKEIRRDKDKSWDINKIINAIKIEKPKRWYVSVIVQLFIYAACVGACLFFLLQVLT